LLKASSFGVEFALNLLDRCNAVLYELIDLCSLALVAHQWRD